MSDEADIDDLWRDLRPALEMAFRRGFKAGAESKANELAEALKSLGIVAQVQIIGTGSGDPRAMLGGTPAGAAPEGDKQRRQRAARGSVKAAVDAWLPGKNNFVRKDAVAEVVAANPEISPKSVYNQLAVLVADGTFKAEGDRMIRVARAVHEQPLPPGFWGVRAEGAPP